MAKRWSFEEDYIVCKFCIEKQYDNIDGQLLDELVKRLTEEGFDLRSNAAVYKRARDFTYLLRGWESPYATAQVKRICQYVSDWSPELEDEYQQWIRRYVDEVYSLNAAVDENAIWLNNQKPTATQILTIDEPETEPQFYKVLDELLKKYYEKHKEDKKTLGAIKKQFKDSLVETYGVSIDTFNSIRREKYKTVSRRVLFRLCFALELDHEDAKQLLGSVGYDFRRNVKEEVVIEAILKCGNPRRFLIFEVNDTLQKYGCSPLFC
jgi:DNA-binding Xre family transcriptional regulator